MTSLKGACDAEEETERKNVHIRERRYGAFQRSVSLPEYVEPEEAEAEFVDGALQVTLAKVAVEKPKRIEVKSG